MKSKYGILFLAFVMLTLGMMAQGVYIPKSNDIQERNGKQYYVHTVQKGQTVYSIAKTYDVSIDEIYFENPSSRYGLQIGQKLWIPTINKEREVTKEVSSANFDFFYHIANANEHFSEIAKLYNIPERYIHLANPKLTEPLLEGEYVKIPVEAAFPILDGKTTKPYTEPEISYIPPPSNSSTQTSDTHINKNNSVSKNEVSFNPNIKVMEDYRHVVINGENLKSIADKYQISVADLKTVNPGLQEVVQGDRLRIPTYAKIPGVNNYKNSVTSNGQQHKQTEPQKKHTDKSTTFFKYTVQNGDNIYVIARKFGVSPKTLLKFNRSIKGMKVYEGEVLTIPKLQTNPHFIYYQVPRKTKLKKIARLFKISYTQLKNANPGLKNRVYAGQTVKIPGGEKAVLISGKPEVNKTKESATNNKPKQTNCQPRPYRGKVFKVALMIPLYLEEIDSINIEEFNKTFKPQFKPFRFIKFLEGAFIAIDSLKNMGYNIDLNIYDVDNKITKTAKTLQYPELKDMDMIIGPFYSKSFNQVALFAENFDIPVINPFTFREEILGRYNNVVKVKPGVSSQIPLLAKLISNRFAKDKIFIVTQNAYKDADLVAKLKSELASAVPSSIKLSNVDINNLSYEVDNRLDDEDEVVSPYYNLEGKPIDPAIIEANLYDSTTFNNTPISINYSIDSINPFFNQASTIRKNLVIIYSTERPFIMDVVNQLNRVRDTFDIQIVGIPLWEQINNMDYQLLNNLKLTYFSSNYINYDDYRVKQFISKFRTGYNTEPDSFGYSGFDITLFFVKALCDYGKRFTKCLPAVNSLTLENGFKFEKVKDTDNNFENVLWNIIQIKNYKTIRLPESNLIPVNSSTDD